MLVLVLNCGSTSVKFDLVDTRAGRSIWGGSLTGIGGVDARLRLSGGGRQAQPEQIREVAVANLEQGLALALDLYLSTEQGPAQQAEVVAHRIGHGGVRYRQAVEIDAAVEAEIERLIPVVPLHHPAMLAGIHAARRLLPGLPQVAVFDTAFHATIPDHAAVYGLPYEWFERGVRKYGFHGNAHHFAAEAAGEFLGLAPEHTRLVTCHLGGGCSVSAVAGGRSLDNSLGFSSLAGLIMGSRCGDIDPGLLLYLQQVQGLSPGQLEELLARRGGLAGISGLGEDMRAIEQAAAEGNARAQLAVRAFCYRVKLYIGAYLAVLGGAAAVVFTGGIGANSPTARAGCLEGMAELGFAIDESRNRACRVSSEEPVVDIGSSEASGRVLVVAVDEELMIARQCEQALSGDSDS